MGMIAHLVMAPHSCNAILARGSLPCFCFESVCFASCSIPTMSASISIFVHEGLGMLGSFSCVQNMSSVGSEGSVSICTGFVPRIDNVYGMRGLGCFATLALRRSTSTTTG